MVPACALGLVLLLLSVPEASAAEVGRLRTHALELVNRSRGDHGLPSLMLDATLSSIAQHHADDMARRDYYSHTSPEGASVMDRYVDAGGSRWRLVAENIARCRACTSPPTSARLDLLHRGWMDSAPHRQNILHRGLDRFGFGIAVHPEHGLFAVQTFAGPGTPRMTEDAAEGEALAPEEQLALAVALTNRARRDRGMSPLEPSAALAEASRSFLHGKSPADGDGQGQEHDSLSALLPPGRAGLGAISWISAECGGCGRQPTAADIRYFHGRWLADEARRKSLLDAEATHMAFAIRADGQGWKIALIAVARKR